MQITPLHARWLDALAGRDQGTLLIALAALLAVLWLCYGRWLWPRLLPAFRRAVLPLFLLTLLIAALGMSYADRSAPFDAHHFDPAVLFADPGVAVDRLRGVDLAPGRSWR